MHIISIFIRIYKHVYFTRRTAGPIDICHQERSASQEKLFNTEAGLTLAQGLF